MLVANAYLRRAEEYKKVGQDSQVNVDFAMCRAYGLQSALYQWLNSKNFDCD